MSWFSSFTMVMMVFGFVAYGWASGVKDAGGRGVYPPWVAMSWAIAWAWLTVTEIGWI